MTQIKTKRKEISVSFKGLVAGGGEKWGILECPSATGEG